MEHSIYTDAQQHTAFTCGQQTNEPLAGGRRKAASKCTSKHPLCPFDYSTSERKIGKLISLNLRHRGKQLKERMCFGTSGKDEDKIPGGLAFWLLLQHADD